MIRRVYPQQLRPFWPAIKHGLTQVNRISGDDQLPTYLNNVLQKIIIETYQAWVCLGEDRKIKGIAITELCEDTGGITHLMINSLYGYSQMTQEDRDEFISAINELAQSKKCNKIFAQSSIMAVMNALQNMGFKENVRIFTKDIEPSSGGG